MEEKRSRLPGKIGETTMADGKRVAGRKPVAPEVRYEGMSLRHERVENAKLPKINIFYMPGTKERADQIAYGIEEEGLPRCGYESSAPFAEALEDTMRKGLGVAVAVDESIAQIFCRQFKKSEAFMESGGRDKEALRITGKNAARILKHKPFILEGQET